MFSTTVQLRGMVESAEESNPGLNGKNHSIPTIPTRVRPIQQDKEKVVRNIPILRKGIRFFPKTQKPDEIQENEVDEAQLMTILFEKATFTKEESRRGNTDHIRIIRSNRNPNYLFRIVELPNDRIDNRECEAGMRVGLQYRGHKKFPVSMGDLNSTETI